MSRARRALLVAAVALVAALGAGCADQPPPLPALPASAEQPAAAGVPVSLADRQQAVNAPVAPGYGIEIPSLGVSSSLVELGINEDRTVQVPEVNRPEQLGYYTLGPKPGELGPAVVLGHVRSNGRDGAFARLGELRPGDAVRATTPEGWMRYIVTATETVPKSAFPTSRVYSDTPDAQLRLITCGGVFDPTTRHYDANVIVYATASL